MTAQTIVFSRWGTFGSCIACWKADVTMFGVIYEDGIPGAGCGETRLCRGRS